MARCSEVLFFSLALLMAGCLQSIAASPPATGAFVRVNQVGYAPGATKVAVLLSATATSGATFNVIDAAGGKTVLAAPVAGEPLAWSKSFPFAYAIDFGKVVAPGTYVIQVEGAAAATSPTFRVDDARKLYAPLVANAAAFYAAQHAAHSGDAAARAYQTPAFRGDDLTGGLTAVGGPIDVSGGWYDAGDYLEFVETASYADAALLLTARDHPASPVAAEARYGLLWLLKMWDPQTRTLLYQVGVGDGDARVRGDHDGWRLPAADDAIAAAAGEPEWFLRHRPVFRTGPPGTPVSPNFAGRLAAAFALGQQVFHASDPALADRCLNAARAVFAAARTDGVGQLLTTAPFGYYGESEWRDDMEWGAAELYTATGDPAYLRAAAHWAHAYLAAHGADVPNLYDVGAIAHYELAKALGEPRAPAGLEVNRQDLIDAIDAQLKEAAARSAKDPFGLGVPYDTGDLTPHVIGLAVEAGFYDELTGTDRYAAMEQRHRDWVLGNNAWGVSFVVGAGSNFPRHLHHPIANLTGRQWTGAVIDGPSGEREVARALKDVPDGAKVDPTEAPDAYASFSGQGVRFADHVAVYACTEPALDYAALSALLFEQAR